MTKHVLENITIEEAKQKVEKYRKWMNETESEHMYWCYKNDMEAWKEAVIQLKEANDE